MPINFKLKHLWLILYLLLASSIILANMLLYQQHQRYLQQLADQKVLGIQASQKAEEVSFWENIQERFPTYKPAQTRLQQLQTGNSN